MQLVGVQDVALAGQAVAALIAIAERLNPGERNADRIGVVAVRREGRSAQMRLQPFDPLHPGPISMRNRVTGQRRSAAHKPSRRPLPLPARLIPMGRMLQEGTDSGQPFPSPELARCLAGPRRHGGDGKPGTLDDERHGDRRRFRRPPLVGLSAASSWAQRRCCSRWRRAWWPCSGRCRGLRRCWSPLGRLYRLPGVRSRPRHRCAARPGRSHPILRGGFLLAIANPKAYVAIASVFAGTQLIGDMPFWTLCSRRPSSTLMIVAIQSVWLSAGARSPDFCVTHGLAHRPSAVCGDASATTIVAIAHG